MRKRFQTLLACGAMLVLATPSLTAQYEVVDLGTLGGTYSEALSVSNNGYIAGFSSEGGVRAFVRSESDAMRNLGTLGGLYSKAYGVNMHARAVGEASISGGVHHAFIWDDTNGMRDIDTLSIVYGSAARAINDTGQVAGFVYVDGSKPFLWTEDSGMQLLSMLPGFTHAGAYAINNSGMTAGSGSGTTFSQHAVVWDSEGNMSDIGTLTGAGASYARGIDDSGQVVGWSSSTVPTPKGGPSDHAFLWDAGSGMRDLGTLPGYGHSYAYDVNNHGQVVGYALGAVPSTAFIWDEAGGMRALENLPGTTNSYAYGINDSGWIVGYSEEGTAGNAHAVLWKPVPEPSGLLALGCGLMVLGLPWMRRRRSR